jgi:hypothetical protein
MHTKLSQVRLLDMTWHVTALLDTWGIES